MNSSELNQLKVSKYNLSLRHDHENYYLVNSLSCSVLKLKESSISFMHNLLLKDETPINITLDDELKQLLVSNGFLVPSDFDEIEWLEKIHWKSRFGREAVGIGIAPTLGCNFRCTYCYQEHPNLHMSSETEDSIIKYIEANISNKKLLKLMWFGGEPLLRIDRIYSMSKKMMNISKKLGVEYYAAITTNGYLLNEQNISILLESGIKDIQVTLDGPPEIHNNRRYLSGKQPTFETIFINIKKIAKKIPRIIIRINIDKRNKNNIPSLLELLSPVKESIYLAFRPATSPESPQIDESWCIPPLSFWDIEKELNILAEKMEFRLMRGYAFPGTSYCSGYQQNSITIDPYGDVHKCPLCLGRRSQRYGILNFKGDLIVEKGGLQDKWGQWSPFLDEKCRECKALPLCMGGCLWFAERDKDTSLQCFAKHRLVEGIVGEDMLFNAIIQTQQDKEVGLCLD